MYSKSQTIAYGLTIFILLNALFVVSHDNYEIARSMQEQFETAFIQTVGDQPFMATELALIYDSLDNFYASASGEAMALLDPKGSDDDIIRVGRQVYLAFADVAYQGKVAGEQIEWNYDPVVPSLGPSGRSLPEGESYIEGTLEPIYNIVP